MKCMIAGIFFIPFMYGGLYFDGYIGHLSIMLIAVPIIFQKKLFQNDLLCGVISIVCAGYLSQFFYFLTDSRYDLKEFINLQISVLLLLIILGAIKYYLWKHFVGKKGQKK